MNQTKYNKVLAKLREIDPELTEERFSLHYLCKSIHYISMIKSRGTDISSSALILLLKKLCFLSSSWGEIAKSENDRVAIRARSKAIHYNETKELVLTILIE